MYLYFLSKKTQGVDALWKLVKSKYKVVAPELSSSLEEYISTSGKANCDERILTSILLFESLLKAPFFNPNFAPKALKKDTCGKPYFGGSSLKISIAHNEKFVLIGYDEGAEIGVDIESEISSERAEKLEKRFPQISSLQAGWTEEISAFLMSHNGELKPINLTSADDSFTAKWTAAESVMKCDGRGFSALPELEKIKKEMNVFTLVFDSENGKEYISVAIKKH